MTEIEKIHRGEAWSALITLKNSDGSAQNSTGYTVTAAAIHRAATIPVTVEAVSEAAGQYRLRLSPTQTLALPIGALTTLRLTEVPPGGEPVITDLLTLEGLA
jgi:hypothetical protein